MVTKTLNDFPTSQGKMYVLISMMQKSVRRGLEEDALYAVWALEMLGYVRVAMTRLRVTAYEDIGAADPLAVLLATRALDDAEKALQNKKGFGLELNTAVLALCRAKKSRDADNALPVVWSALALGEPKEIQDYVFDKHTLLGKQMGRKEKFFTEHSSVLVPDHSNPEYKAKSAMLWEWEEENNASLYDMAKERLVGKPKDPAPADPPKGKDLFSF